MFTKIVIAQNIHISATASFIKDVYNYFIDALQSREFVPYGALCDQQVLWCKKWGAQVIGFYQQAPKRVMLNAVMLVLMSRATKPFIFFESAVQGPINRNVKNTQKIKGE